jgi:transposase
MRRLHLTDSHWAFIQPLVPPPAPTGRPRADDRRSIEGMVYLRSSGSRWQALPRAYGAPTTVWRRLKRWGELGIWGAGSLSGAPRSPTETDRISSTGPSPFLTARSRQPGQAGTGGDKGGRTRKGKGATWLLDGCWMAAGWLLDGCWMAARG